MVTKASHGLGSAYAGSDGSGTHMSGQDATLLLGLAGLAVEQVELDGECQGGARGHRMTRPRRLPSCGVLSTSAQEATP